MKGYHEAVMLDHFFCVQNLSVETRLHYKKIKAKFSQAKQNLGAKEVDNVKETHQYMDIFDG